MAPCDADGERASTIAPLTIRMAAEPGPIDRALTALEDDYEDDLDDVDEDELDEDDDEDDLEDVGRAEIDEDPFA